MPRTARASVGDICYHVINRGNAQIEVFHKDGDYRAFVELIGLACQRIPMRVLAYCVMPNHFHLALWPRSDKDLGRWMQWLLTATCGVIINTSAQAVTYGKADSRLFLSSKVITCSPCYAMLRKSTASWSRSTEPKAGAGPACKLASE